MIELLMMAFGLVALAGAVDLRDPRDRRGGRTPGPDCPKCRYSLSGLATGAPCPECGLTPQQRARYAPGVRSKLPAVSAALAASFLCLAAASLAVCEVAGADRSGAIFVGAFAMPPFVVALVAAFVLWARPWIAAMVAASAAVSIALSHILVAWLTMNVHPPDAQAGLFILVLPITGIPSMGYGLLVGVLLARLRR